MKNEIKQLKEKKNVIIKDITTIHLDPLLALFLLCINHNKSY